MDPVFHAIKDKGWFTFKTPDGDGFDDFHLHLGTFAEGTDLDVIVRKARKPSSTPQMRYYYGVVLKMLSDWSGHTPDEMDSYLKWELLRQTDDNGLEYVPSKKDLSTVEFEEYLDRVRMHAAIRFEVPIPLPNEVDYAKGE